MARPILSEYGPDIKGRPSPGRATSGGVTSARDVSPAFEECAEAPVPTTPCNQKQLETIRRGKKACKQKICGS